MNGAYLYPHSPSRLHSTRGAGRPLTRHENSTSWPSTTASSCRRRAPEISGGAAPTQPRRHTRHSDTRNTKTHTTRRHTQHNDTQISGTQETHQEHTSSGFCHLPQMRYVLVTMAGHNNIVCSEFNFTTKTHHLISCFVFIVVLSSPCTTML